MSWTSKLVVVVAVAAFAGAVSLDASAAAVQVGASQLIGQLDYSDTFSVTGAIGSTPSAANPRPDGYTGSNAFGAHNVENLHGNPTAAFTPFALQYATSANTPNGSHAGNPGAASGIASQQTGDQSIGYTLRDSYIVQVDMVFPQNPGRIDIGTYANAGDQLWQNGAVNVFFRPDGTVDLYNGSVQTFTGINLGPADDDWHNFAVHFDKPGNSIKIWFDEMLQADLDLSTFGNGVYQNFPTNAVGFGGETLNSSRPLLFDNFQVGAAVPEPASALLLLGLCAGLLGLRRRSASI